MTIHDLSSCKHDLCGSRCGVQTLNTVDADDMFCAVELLFSTTLLDFTKWGSEECTPTRCSAPLRPEMQNGVTKAD